MDYISPMMQRIPKITSERCDASKEVTAELNAFYYDTQEFMQSKRFQRFVVLVESQICDFLKKMQLQSNRENGSDSAAMAVLFRKVLQEAVCNHTESILKDEGEEKESLENSKVAFITKEHFAVSVSVDAILDVIGERHYSNLWALENLHEDAGTAFAGEDKIDEHPIMQSIYNVLESPMFQFLFEDALERACFDFIHLEAASNSLEEDNWLTKIKQLSYRQTMFIMQKVFEYLLYNTEDYAFMCLMHKQEKNSVPEVLLQAKILREENSALSEQVEALRAELAAVKEQLTKQGTVHDELQNKISGMVSSSSKNARLQRELQKQRDECKRLTEKYDSLSRYAEQLQATDEEPEDDTPVFDDDAFRDKRIVFVRDKKNEGYVMMQRLAERFPNAKFTNCIASEINAKATDIIAVMTAYVCHGTYWGAENIAKRKNIPITYIKSKNPSLIINEICTALSEQKGE